MKFLNHVSISFLHSVISADPGFDLLETINILTDYLLSSPNLMACKNSKTNLLGKYHMDHRRLISFQEWDIQGKKKQKKGKSCLSWKWEKNPGEGQHFSVLWLAMNLKHWLGWGSQVPSVLLHWEQRLGLLLSQLQTRAPFTSCKITQHHTLII